MQKKQVNAVVVNAPHDVKKEIRQVEWNDDQVLIKVERGGICGSDIHYFLHGRAGMSILKTPMILGHEFVGTVEQASAESGLTAGQRVAVNPSQPCQTCRYCREGKQNLCRAMRFMGSAQFFPHVNGGFADYVAVLPYQCVPYASHADPKVIAFAEPLAVCIHAVRQAGDLIGKKVLVTGAGPIGCLVIAAVLAAGATEVIATDISERCRALALEMGAREAADPRDDTLLTQWQADGGRFDVCFEASGATAAVASTVALTRPGGTIVQLGMGSPSVDYPIGPLLVKEIQLRGSFRFNGEFDTAVRWLESGRINPLPLLTAEMPMADAAAALALAADKERAAKIQLVF
ncbi:Alcohol dehydrogenase GroES domain-containing protein (plasmid) [Sodalis praecaptivus]|uniref:Alcohol dehydrogenase GroES domain-containing protein n=1 Tax=Sodalis praecaptivus TaxID=1239307 RepID=W0I3K7_9GAMM|nr:L-idonate 5-dehydrogenase [Sodalis praecaptivus]AHF79055.1 Alcohol dehydrogenase GroES domain-containing protein [Sodalis praecaptivus]